jgi:hypothetical protein
LVINARREKGIPAPEHHQRHSSTIAAARRYLHGEKISTRIAEFFGDKKRLVRCSGNDK